VSEQFLNGTSAQYRLCSAILLKVQGSFALNPKNWLSKDWTQ